MNVLYSQGVKKTKANKLSAGCAAAPHCIGGVGGGGGGLVGVCYLGLLHPQTVASGANCQL